MGKYLLLVLAAFTLVTYEAQACWAHTQTKQGLQDKFSGASGARRAGVGGVAVKNRKGSGSAMDENFFSKLNQSGGNTGSFSTGIDGAPAGSSDSPL